MVIKAIGKGKKKRYEILSESKHNGHRKRLSKPASKKQTLKRLRQIEVNDNARALRLTSHATFFSTSSITVKRIKSFIE